MVQAMPKKEPWTGYVVKEFLDQTGMENTLCGKEADVSTLVNGGTQGHLCWDCNVIAKDLLDADIQAYGEPSAKVIWRRRTGPG